jgi:predicted phage terminase large subunit-like protein
MLQAEFWRRSLSEYAKAAWGVVEPAARYAHNWHIDAICEHLEAVTWGEIRNLAINIPPRCMKSLLVSVFWPTWTWTNLPETQFLFASYAEALALRDSVKCRRVIFTPWYQERWGGLFQITGDQNQKSKFENDRGGHRIAAGLGGSITGEGADIIVGDDLVKAKDADSEAVLDAAVAFWKETLSTRGNDPKTVRKVLIMQRLSQRDPTGFILEEMRKGGEHFELLILPMEYERSTYVTGLGWSDPRREEGELLWPERFGRQEVELLKKTLGERGAAGQLQQRPAPPGGMVFRKAWWEGQSRYRYGKLEAVSRWLSVDSALKDEDENAYSVISTWDMLADYRIALANVWREKVTFPVLIEEITRQAVLAQRGDLLAGVVIEDRVSGTSAVQTLRATAPDWLAERTIAFPVGQRGKVYRAKQASVWCERGCVLLPYPSEHTPWLFAFEDELFTFPGSRFADQVDTLSQIVLYLEWYLSSYWQGVIAG